MKAARFLLAPLSLLVAGCVSGEVRKEAPVVEMKARAPKPTEARKKVAIVDFSDKTEYGRGRLGTAAADILATYLVKSGQVRVIERQQMEKLLSEQKIEHSEVTDAATAVRLGKVLNVDLLVFGAVSNFGVRTQGTDVLVYQGKKQIAESTVDVRMVEVETAEVVYAETGRGGAERSTSGSLGLGGRMSYDETLAGDSLRAAIVKMLDDMLDRAG